MELFGEFLQTVRASCALVSAGVPHNLIEVISNLASNSFFVMPAFVTIKKQLSGAKLVPVGILVEFSLIIGSIKRTPL